MATQLPATLVDALAPALNEVPTHRHELFMARLKRWWPDLLAALSAVYDDPESLAVRAVTQAAHAFAEREDALHALDVVRSLEPDWLQRPDALGYAAYADRFAQSLQGVGEHVEYLRELGVTYLHLMPLLQSRPAPNDGGYAVADYRRVQPELGTVADLKQLTATLREAEISLCLDLVLNHVAYEHPWAQAARQGDPHYRAYFHCYDSREVPDAYEATLPEVFPAFAPGNFTFDPDMEAWVWTTFNSYQWDMAWSNPDVFCEYADIILWLSNLGVEVLRLDAIAFIWKRLGTNSQNQPEVHAITQALRSLTRIACPATVFLAEAIVGPRDLVHYLGTRERHGKVSDLAYHNSLMVQLWSALASGNVRLATHALRGLPEIPASATWITYLRCHDDIGWAIDDDDAASVGLSGWGHRAFLSAFYSGAFPGSYARGLVFQENAATGDRRISGSLASLAGLESAEEADDVDAAEAAVSRILLLHAVILGWGGVPVIWMGDELALLNDYDWDADPRYAGDNRWVHRPRMPWPHAAHITEQPRALTPAARVYSGLRHLIAARARVAQLHGRLHTDVLEPSDPGVLIVRRPHALGPFIGLYNVTSTWRPVPPDRLYASGLDIDRCFDWIGAEPPHRGGDGQIWLAPYAAQWLTAD
ncbi:MAG TPA: alpha-amylase family protein [Nocardioidaceae bacterium]|nr:alpha-amylase family protein [Nocardioidaceae bacterium]